MDYLAAPYSTGFDDNTPKDKKALLMNIRSVLINNACAQLRLKGYYVYSPITFGVPLEEHLPLSVAEDHDFWMDHCYHMIDLCDRMFILNLEGWDKSDGIALEIKRAKSNNTPIYIVDHLTLDRTLYEE